MFIQKYVYSNYQKVTWGGSAIASYCWDETLLILGLKIFMLLRVN